ncbi:hypothetical protein HO710_10450 [Streptococcus suis]|nr:hypothetical protein [Streptococcus suis]
MAGPSLVLTGWDKPTNQREGVIGDVDILLVFVGDFFNANHVRPHFMLIDLL